MTKKCSIVLSLAYILLSLNLSSQNPIIQSGISDPHIRIFNDTIYLYSGHDDDPNAKLWVMKDWRVFSTTDLLNWKNRKTISPKENYMDDNSIDCWASDAASRNGKFYFYFSDQKRGIGVMSSDSPAGNFKDELGKALVSPMHDPTVFIDSDENKTPFLIYGDKEGGGFHIAQLNNDMMSLAHQPKTIMIIGEEWQNSPKWMDKNYLFKHKDTYYLSWGRDYAISKNIYGPYNCVGALGHGYQLNEFAHGSFFNWKGQFYHVWCYYLKPGYKYRETIISYCHIDTEGKVYTDTKFLDQHFKNGVGQYNANWEKIEAEWYYELSGNVNKKRMNSGFIMTGFKTGDWLRFANVEFEKDYSMLKSNLSIKGNGQLEIRSNGIDGEILGVIKLENPNKNTDLHEISCEFKAIQDCHDIYMVFKGVDNSTVDIDWFKFE